MRVPLLFDVDTGIDDALAILFALSQPQAEIVAIGTVAGNIDVDAATRNTLSVLEMAGAGPIPVARGCDAPLLAVPGDARNVHGDDGLGNTRPPAPKRKPSDEHAVAQLLRLTHERPGELTIVATGPLTNLAVALKQDPELATRVRRLVMMGGAASAPGNRSPVAEFNIAHDPEAAAIVFNAGWRVTMVGLDVTMKSVLTERHLAQLRAARRPVARFVARMVAHYMRSYRGVFGRNVCPLHDPLAVAIALDPSLATTLPTRVEVETQGAFTRGLTVVERRQLYRLTLTPQRDADGPRPLPPLPQPRGVNADVCLDVDVEAFIARFIEGVTKL